MIRPLTIADVPAAVQLSSVAGWNQTAADWRMLLDLEPQGCFGIDREGRLAATATLVCYGQRLAWLGMVLTAPEFRRRAYARTLVSHMLALADARAIATVKLDATEKGAPLYQSLGFRAEQAIERRAGFGRGAAVHSEPASDLTIIDQLASAADRSKMLALLAARSRLYAADGGFLLTRPGRLAGYLGPSVAGSPEIARTLIGQATEDASGPMFWDLMTANSHALALADLFGFRTERRLLRMVRGQELRGKEELVYALAGFELG